MRKENPIFHFFTNHFGAEMTASQEAYVLNAYRKEQYKKKEQLFGQGDVNTRHYIIEKGLLRLFLIDSKGKEINILFAKEYQVIGDLATPEPTHFFLEACEDSIVYSISESGLQDLMTYLDIGKSLDPSNGLRRSYIYIQKRLVSILSKSAEENYLEFQQRHPDLIQRLPQYHIAAFSWNQP